MNEATDGERLARAFRRARADYHAWRDAKMYLGLVERGELPGEPELVEANRAILHEIESEWDGPVDSSRLVLEWQSSQEALGAYLRVYGPLEADGRLWTFRDNQPCWKELPR
jgi:hypothetical protein